MEEQEIDNEVRALIDYVEESGFTEDECDVVFRQTQNKLFGDKPIKLKKYDHLMIMKKHIELLEKKGFDNIDKIFTLGSFFAPDIKEKFEEDIKNNPGDIRGLFYFQEMKTNILELLMLPNLKNSNVIISFDNDNTLKFFYNNDKLWDKENERMDPKILEKLKKALVKEIKAYDVEMKNPNKKRKNLVFGCGVYGDKRVDMLHIDLDDEEDA